MADDIETLVGRFQRDGVVHARAILSPDEVAGFAAAIDHAVATRKRSDPRALVDKSAYEQSFIQCQYLWEDFPAVRGLTFHPKVAGLAAALIGAERVRLWHDQALYKEPGGRETDAHQDHAYWPIAETDTLTVWIPLCEVDERTGCMGYVPGTHRGDCEFVDIFTAPGSGKALEAKYGDIAPVFVSCAPGDLLLHPGRTVHMAKPNRSERMRRAYTAIYFRDGCTRASGYAHPSVDRDAIAIGAPIVGPATPVAWPLSDEGLPQPRPWPVAVSDRQRRASALGVIPSTKD